MNHKKHIVNEWVVAGRGNNIYTVPDELREHSAAVRAIINVLESTPSFFKMLADFNVSATPYSPENNDAWSRMWRVVQQQVESSGNMLPDDVWNKVKSYRWSRIRSDAADAPKGSDLNSSSSNFNAFDRQYNKTLAYLQSNMPSYQAHETPQYMHGKTHKPIDAGNNVK